MTETDPNAFPSDAQVPAEDEIVAGPDAGYRWKHLLMAVLVIAGGLWFAYDGWVRWPAENTRADKVQKDKDAAEQERVVDKEKVEKLSRELSELKRHTELDLLFQKVLAFTLPTFGLIWGIWTLKDTRGQYRMAGNTLTAPGHPPITYENIRRIDKRKWDRKGVAFIHYEHGNPPTPAVMKLDDFAYERRATDAILQRIEQNVLTTQIPGAPR